MPSTVYRSSCVPLLCLLLLVGIGCSDQSEKTTNDQGKAGSETKTSDLLANALDMLQPDRLGVSSDYGTALAVMNDWLGDHEKQVPDLALPGESFTALLSDEARRRIDMERFVRRDCDHVRMALMSRTILDRLQSGAGDDQTRVVRLFEYLTRQVVLVEPEDAAPLSPYEVLVYGQGTARDRAWVFAELVRQLRLDVVFLAAVDDSGDGLVGVCLKDEVLLFDPLLGEPLPDAGGEGSDGLLTLAELQQLKAWPPRLEASSDDGYRFSVDAVREFRPALIASSELWSLRMKRLQTVLGGTRDLVVYRPIVTDEGLEGTRERVLETAGGIWPAESFQIWAYPESQLQITTSLSEQQSQQMRRLQLVMAAPLLSEAEQAAAEELTVSLALGRADEEGNTNELVNIRNDAVPSLMKTRVMQLQGKTADAVQFYQSIRFRIGRMQAAAMSGEVLRAHQLAADAATYWIATCQMDDLDWPTAMNSLRQYRRLFPTGRWSDGSRLIEARCAFEAGQPDAALQALSEIKPDAPQSLAARYLSAGLAQPQPPSDSTANE